MSYSIKVSISAINDISRQLLSLFDIQIEKINSGSLSTSIDEDTITSSKEIQPEDKVIVDLVNKRHFLVNELFKSYSQDQISTEIIMINEMISLDEKLTSHSMKNKEILTEQILKLKKSKKVNSLYQKY